MARPLRRPTVGTGPPCGGPRGSSWMRTAPCPCHTQICRRVPGASSTPCRRLCCPRLPALRASPTSPARCSSAAPWHVATHHALTPRAGASLVSPATPEPTTSLPKPTSEPGATSCVARAPTLPGPEGTAGRGGCGAGPARGGCARAGTPGGQHRPLMARRCDWLSNQRPGRMYMPFLAALQGAWRKHCPQRRRNPPSARTKLMGHRWPRLPLLRRGSLRPRGPLPRDPLGVIQNRSWGPRGP